MVHSVKMNQKRESAMSLPTQSPAERCRSVLQECIDWRDAYTASLQPEAHHRDVVHVDINLLIRSSLHPLDPFEMQALLQAFES